MLIDTNIIIHWLNGDEKIINFFEAHLEQTFSISVITEMELHMGINKHEIDTKKLKMLLKPFQVISLHSEIGHLVVNFLQKKQIKTLRNINLQDIIIACSALYYKKTLVTRNTKDFLKFKDIKVVNPFK